MLHESSSEVRVPPIESLAIFVTIYKGNKSLHTISYDTFAYNKETSNVFPAEPNTVMYSEEKKYMIKTIRNGVSLTNTSSNIFFFRK